MTRNRRNVNWSRENINCKRKGDRTVTGKDIINEYTATEFQRNFNYS